MTVLEACAMLELGDGIKPNIELTFGSSGVPFNPKNSLEMMAYGDFLIKTCHVWEGGVNIHPLRRYYMAEFSFRFGKFRECFML